MSRLPTFLFAAVMGLALPMSAIAQTPPRTLSVTGDAEASAVPDMATVNLGVAAEAPTAAEATDQASAAMTAILAELTALGIDAVDVQTSGLRLSPRYATTVLGNTDYSTVTSYSAANELQIKVRDLSALGGLLSTVIGTGANTLNGVAFGLQDSASLLDEARLAAVAEAQRRAALYAGAAGLTLGDIVQLNENGYSGYQPLQSAMMRDGAVSESLSYDVPVAQGQITVSANVAMIYALVE
jgi:hypothetical protein